MFFADFRFITLWWFTYLIVGFSALPLTFYFFGRFWDRGYIFSKTIGLVLITFLTLILGIFKLVPFTSISVIVLLFLVYVFGLFLCQKNKIKVNFSLHWKIFLLEELIFLLILTVWSFVRGFAPDIEGLEKLL